MNGRLEHAIEELIFEDTGSITAHKLVAVRCHWVYSDKSFSILKRSASSRSTILLYRCIRIARGCMSGIVYLYFHRLSQIEFHCAGSQLYAFYKHLTARFTILHESPEEGGLAHCSVAQQYDFVDIGLHLASFIVQVMLLTHPPINTLKMSYSNSEYYYRGYLW